MAIIRAPDAAKLSRQERIEKLAELKLELVKSGVAAKKATGKTKEIKRAIARLMTFNASQQEGLSK